MPNCGEVGKDYEVSLLSKLCALRYTGIYFFGNENKMVTVKM